MTSSKYILWLVAAALLIFSADHSAAQTWNGGGANDNWSTAGNWTGGVPANPSPAAGTANVFFDGTLRLAPNIDVAWNINSLTFNATAGAFTIGGQQLFLEAGITDNSTNTQIIMAPLKLGVASASQTFTTVAGGYLVIGNMDWYGSALTVGGAGNTLFSGVGTDSSPGASLIKNGTGTLTMTNANAYTGATTVNAGTLIVGANNALGTTAGGTTVSNGGTLAFQGGVTYNTKEGLKIFGVGATNVGRAGAMDNLSGTNSFAGPITLGEASTIGSSAGLLTLGGVVTNGGFLLRVNGAGDVAMTNRIIGAGGLTKNGSGTLILSASNLYTGVTTINSNGTLIVTANGALGTTGGGTTVSNGGTLGFQGGVTYNTKEGLKIFGVGATNVGRAGAIDNVSGTNSFAGPITLGAASAIGSSAGLLTLGGAVTNGGFLLTVNSTGGNVTMTNRISGTGGLTKNGSGTLTLSGATANTYSGMTTVSNGILMLSKAAGVNAFGGGLTIGDGVGGPNADVVRLGAANQIPGAVIILNSGLLDLNGFSEGITTLTMTGGNITTGTGTLTLGGNVIGNADANTATISGNLALGSTTRTFTIASGAASPGMSISAMVSGTGGLTKNGAGTLVLSSSNTYSGATAVSAGTLIVAANSALGTTAGGTTVSNGGTLGFQGGVTYNTKESVKIYGAGTAGSSGAIDNVSGTNSFAGPITLGAASTIGSSADQLTVSGAVTNGGFLLTVAGAGNTTVNGIISGTGGLTKNGAGSVTLSGAAPNTFTGATAVNAGTLNLASAGALGATSSVTLNSGGTLLLSGAPTADRINNTAGLALAGGTLNQNGATETMGILTLTANSVINLGAAGGLTFANTTWSPGTFTLTINGWTGTSGAAGSSTGATLSFNSTMSGQTLNNINFVGYAWGGYVLSTGEIIPVPEPASIMAGLLLVLLLGWQTLRRFRRPCSRRL